MIYTITLNPSLDRVIEVDELVEDDANRMRSDIKYPGGKGIDVSRVITRFGYDTIATGFLGGFSGLELEGMLINEGVKTDFIKISEDTRINIYIFDKSKGVRYSLNAKGPEVKPVDLAKLFEKIRGLYEDKIDYVVMSGSIPVGISKNIYAQLLMEFNKKGIKCVVDTDGEALLKAIEEKPFLIKPNTHEFKRLIGKDISSEEEIIFYAKGLLNKGVENVMVSMGAKGLILVNSGGVYKAVPPKVIVKSTIGSGDSTIALFILAKVKGLDDMEACKWGVAGGAATAMTKGVELVNPEDFYSILDDVKIERIE